MHRAVSSALLIAIAATSLDAQRGGPGGRGGAAQPAPLRFQFMGPATGGRFASIAGVVGDHKVWYLGAATGGVWKTADSGATFLPVFDKQPVQAIGALAVSASDPNQVWAGTGEAWAIRDADVMGDGIYKSTDAGATWTNVGLRETGRIGRILVHPTNPDIVFACALGRATGPQQERGVYRTTDGGRNWTRVLFVDENTGCSGLSLDPKNPEFVVAGMWQMVMHTWKIQSGGPGSGVFRSKDGGTNWVRLSSGLPVSPTGKTAVAIAPSDPRRVYALVETDRQGSVWRSDDAGDTWRAVSYARPLIGRAGYYIHIMVSPANPDEIVIANSSMWRSMDGGKTFATVNWGGDNHDIWWDPTNANHIGVTNDLNARMSSNHGQSWIQAALPIAQAYHVAIDNQTPYWVYTNRQDNGTMRGPSTAPEQPPTGGRGTSVVAPSFYGAAGGGGGAGRAGGNGGRAGGAGGAGRGAGRGGADSTGAGTSDSTGRGGAAPGGRGAPPDSTGGGGGFGGGGFGGGGGGGGGGFSTWEHGVGGCESGFTLPDLTNPDIVWASCYGNTVTRWDARTSLARSVAPWMHTLDWPPDQLKYRCHWTPPLAIDPFDHNTVYYGCQVVFKTSNGGQSWTAISGDLSTKDPSRVVSSGGLIPDNLGQFYGEVVFAIAPSEIQRGLVWAGTNDGKVWFTRDAGTTWNDVTKGLPIPTWGTVRKIEPSHFDPATAYVAVDFHMMDDRKPYVLKTTDYGKTWRAITGDLPASHPLDYVMSVAENPNRKGMLFAGTGHAFYYSLDDGAHWKAYGDGLPASPVTWVVVSKLYHDVVVSTYGRGVFILKDITSLETSDVTNTDPVQLTVPRSGIRDHRNGSVALSYTLKEQPKDSVSLEILDGANQVVRTMRSIGRAGLNRTTWDMRYDGPRRIDLRTLPPDNPHIWDEPRFQGGGRGAGGPGGRGGQAQGNANGAPAGGAGAAPPATPPAAAMDSAARAPRVLTRGITHWGIDGPARSGPLGAPGKYTARLTVDGVTRTTPFTVARAFTLTAPDSDLKASTAAQVRIRSAMNDAVDLANKLEIMRKQLEDHLTANAGNDAMIQPLKAIDQKLFDVELRILSRSDLNTDDKWYVEPTKLYLTLIWLSGEVGTGAGDVAGGADHRPTDAEMQTLAGLERDLTAAKAAYTRVMADVAAFNRSMAGKLPAITETLSRR